MVEEPSAMDGTGSYPRRVEAVGEGGEASGALLLVAAAAEAGGLGSAFFLGERRRDGREEVRWWCIYGAWWS